MTASNFPACLVFTLGAEGGFVDNPQDPGGATNMGITRATYEAWVGHPVTVDAMKSLPENVAAQIYRANYWNAVNGDGLPAGVDLVVFDFGVNAGTGTSAIELQRCVGVTQDGDIGPITLDAVNNYDAPVLIKKLAAMQEVHYRSLNMPEFLDGWMNRTHARMQRALEMAA